MTSDLLRPNKLFQSKKFQSPLMAYDHIRRHARPHASNVFFFSGSLSPGFVAARQHQRNAR